MLLFGTLSNTNFREILIFKSTAASAYISYLRESGEHEELIDTLFSLGKNDEAAMVEFMLASKKRQSDTKIQALKKCLISGFTDPMLSAENGYVKDYINLLERQIPIDLTDDQNAKVGGNNEIFVQFPKKASLIGQPLLTTLYYCCLYHYDLPKCSLAVDGDGRNRK
uniref:Uncharacterized protein n=1 Tax=Panagrolaimus davidi TaxID=227884 RepID=A0A914QEC6_9BILA